MTDRTPSTFLLGAGPVATALAGALRRAGVPVLGLWARRWEAARAAGATSGVAFFADSFPALLRQAEVVIVAVRDQAVGAVAERAVGEGRLSERVVLLHCSGATAAEEVFAAVRDRVGGVATLHPLRAIADGETGVHTMPGPLRPAL